MLAGIIDGHPSGVDCPLPRTKPGLLDGQPSGLVILLALSPSGITRVTGRTTLRAGWPYCHYRHLAVPGLQEDRDCIGISDTGSVILQ